MFRYQRLKKKLKCQRKHVIFKWVRPKDPTKRENYEGYEGASVSSTPISAYTILIGSADDVVLCACTMNVPKQSHYQSLTNLTQWDTEY